MTSPEEKLEEHLRSLTEYEPSVGFRRRVLRGAHRVQRRERLIALAIVSVLGILVGVGELIATFLHNLNHFLKLDETGAISLSIVMDVLPAGAVILTLAGLVLFGFVTAKLVRGEFDEIFVTEDETSVQ